MSNFLRNLVQILNIRGQFIVNRLYIVADGALTPDEFSTEWTFYNSDSYMRFFRAGDENNDGKIDLEEGNRAFDYFDNDGKYHQYESLYQQITKFKEIKS